jgi:hypothetical protein
MNICTVLLAFLCCFHLVVSLPPALSPTSTFDGIEQAPGIARSVHDEIEAAPDIARSTFDGIEQAPGIARSVQDEIEAAPSVSTPTLDEPERGGHYCLLRKYCQPCTSLAKWLNELILCLGECQCCFENVPRRRSVACSNNHQFCDHCITELLKQNLGKADLPCFAMSQNVCNGKLKIGAVENLLPFPLARLSKKVRRTGIKYDTVMCGVCQGFAVQKHDRTTDLRRICLNEDCGAVECRNCNENWTKSHSCRHVSLCRSYVEDAMISWAGRKVSLFALSN